MAQLYDPAHLVEALRDVAAPTERHHFRVGVGRRLHWRLGFLLGDMAMLVLAVAATALGASAAGLESPSWAWTTSYCLIVLGLLATGGFYGVSFAVRTFDDLRRVVGATALAGISLLAVAAVFGAGYQAIDHVLRLWLFATVYLLAGRTALYWVQRQERIAGEGLRPTLIVGAGRVGRLTAHRLMQMPQLGLQPVGFLDKEPLAAEGNGSDLPVLGASWDLEDVVQRHAVDQVIITFSTAPDDVLLRLVRRCEELGVGVAVVPRLYERTTTRLSVDHIGGLPLVSAHPSDPRGLQFAIKYVVDRIVGLFLVLVLAPVLLAAALATYISVGRPIFFRQRRVGRDGTEFDMLKFRTMHGTPDDRGELDASWAERQLGNVVELDPGRAQTRDPRTRVGSILRRTSCDELPQLLNVLLGHMSLVGPRPERAHYVRRFEGNVYRYGERHRVKSGITGWAQVNGLRGQTSLDDRIEWDNYYIENFSLWFDVKILLLTCAAVFRVTSD